MNSFDPRFSDYLDDELCELAAQWRENYSQVINEITLRNKTKNRVKNVKWVGVKLAPETNELNIALGCWPKPYSEHIAESGQCGRHWIEDWSGLASGVIGQPNHPSISLLKKDVEDLIELLQDSLANMV